MEKGKVIFIGVIVLIALLCVIYVVSITSSKNESTQAADFVVPEVTEKAQTKDDYNSRLSKANKYEEPEKKEELSKSMDFKTYQESEKKEVEIKTEVTNVAVKKERSVRRSAVVTRSEAVQPSSAAREVKPEPEAVVPTAKTEDSGGFGIVVSERTNAKSIPSSSQARKGGFFAASLEENTKIKNQTSVVFFLLSDCVVDGTTFKKNSILYGKAFENGNVFDIQIHQIMNTDGKVYSVNSLFVYDEKYSRGLAGEGKLNQSVRDGANQTTDNVSSSLASSASGSVIGSGVDLAVNAVDNTIKALNRKKEPSISLMKGYKVFIKQD